MPYIGAKVPISVGVDESIHSILKAMYMEYKTKRLNFFFKGKENGFFFFFAYINKHSGL